MSALSKSSYESMNVSGQVMWRGQGLQRSFGEDQSSLFLF
jgi:hypothetical protein